MKDLFNDDIFEQETDSEIMDAVSCSCILQEVNDKFEEWKKFMQCDMNRLSGFTVTEYINQVQKTYQRSISFDVIDEFNVTMNIDSLNMSMLKGYESNGSIAIVDLSLFKMIKNITEINIIKNHYAVNDRCFLLFTNVTGNEIIDKNFSLKICEIFGKNFKNIAFQDVIFTPNAIKNIENNLPDSTYCNICFDCKIREECLYPGMEDSCVLTGIMLRNNTIPGFDAITVHKIFYITQNIIELK